MNKTKTLHSNLFFKSCYGSFFVILLPLFLTLWALSLDHLETISWPVPFSAPLGAAILGSGLVLMVLGMRALWVFGNGLPMNAFPPERLVERSVYRLVPHPIYFGFCLAVFGAAAFAASPSGFWIVGPASIGAVWALVYGYEGPDLDRRLGVMKTAPLLTLPPASAEPLSHLRGAVLILVTWGPWALCYALFSAVPAAPQAQELRFACELAWPHPGAWLWVYSLAYPFIALAPLVFASAREARTTIIGIWAASAVGFAFMLLVPGKVALLPSGGEGLSWLLDANRMLDADWLACPSFHTAWALVAAALYGRRFRFLRIPAFIVATLIAISCVMSGSHAVVDVLGGALLAVFALKFDKLFKKIRQLTENVSNSWTSWRVGPIRIISHVWWTACSAFVGSYVALLLAGPLHAMLFAAVMTAGVSGALAFGRLVEGRHLSRPFGYFGFLIGCIAALAVLFALNPVDTSILAAAIACAAPIAQGIGRGRCVVQGCCHGRPGKGNWTIRVRNPQSRIVCVAALADIPVYATQLLSAILNLVIAAILLFAWQRQASVTLICGLYLFLTALARFAEEGWRGEPQTPGRFGLSLYQWICALLAPLGIALTMLPAPFVPEAAGFTTPAVLVALGVALLMSALMSMDWPQSRLPLSRLAPPN